MPGIGSRFSAFSKTPETSSVSMMSPVEKAKVGDGIGEVDRVGRVRFQRVFQFDHRLLSGRADNR